MRGDIVLATLVLSLGGIGTWLLLPHRHGASRPRSVHAAGALLAGLAVLLLSAFWTPPGSFLTSLFFYGFAFASVGGGILMITNRNPVHSALWFAAVVLATSGLFLLAGAQFLAAGTVIVYAGAIIVTFLFVIMLAQAEGQAAYDRAARSPARATLSCFVLLWALVYVILMVQRPEGPPLDAEGLRSRLVPTAELGTHHGFPAKADVAAVLSRAVSPRARIAVPPPGDPASRPAQTGVPAPHVAGLGGTLFTDHLIALEAVGAILFVALVGAAAIATPKPPTRPGERPAPAPATNL